MDFKCGRLGVLGAAILIIVVGVPWIAFLGQQPRPEIRDSAAKVIVVIMTSIALLAALLWFLAERFVWLPASSTSLIQIPVIVVVVAALFAVPITSAVIDVHSRRPEECHDSVPPFAGPVSPQQAVFIGRMVRVGLAWPSRNAVDHSLGTPKKYWALATVNQKLWGLSWWQGKVVLLTLQTTAQDPFIVGESYFVDGRREAGILTRLLPIFDVSCTRTNLLRNAEVDMRVIRDGLPKSGIRLLGKTVKIEPNGFSVSVPNSFIVIKGPSGQTTSTTSDQNGIYDISGLPPGRYDIGLPGPGDQVVWQRPDCMGHVRDEPRHSGDVRDCTILVK